MVHGSVFKRSRGHLVHIPRRPFFLATILHFPKEVPCDFRLKAEISSLFLVKGRQEMVLGDVTRTSILVGGILLLKKRGKRVLCPKFPLKFT